MSDLTLPLTAPAILAGVHDLPALPAVVLEVLASISNERTNVQDLATKIAHDPALSARTLRLANSSFYGLPRQVTSIADAASILGMRTMRGITAAAGLIGRFQSSACVGFDFKEFWRHSLATALCAQCAARARSLNPDAAFLVGLLHDMGRLGLVTAFPSAYASVLQLQVEQDLFLLEAEQQILGTDHTVVGGLMAGHWRFAPKLVQAIEQHHAPSVEDRTALSDLLSLVHVADNMAHALDLSGLPGEMVPPMSVQAWARLQLSETEVIRILAEAESQHEELCRSLLA